MDRYAQKLAYLGFATYTFNPIAVDDSYGDLAGVRLAAAIEARFPLVNVDLDGGVIAPVWDNFDDNLRDRVERFISDYLETV